MIFMPRQEDVQKLINNHSRRLQILKEQAAKFGLYTPPHILTEIEDTEAAIEKLRTELKEIEARAESTPQAHIPASSGVYGEPQRDSSLSRTRGTVFIAYNPADEAEKEDLVTHLGVLQRQGLIETWTDDQSTPGVDKASEMEEAINRANVTILLITPNFLSSDFVSGEEMKRIMERRQTQAMILYPIIARPCAWKKVPWLARLRVRPRDEKPVWREGGRYVDEELASIAEEIAEIMEKVKPATAESHSQPDK